MAEFELIRRLQQRVNLPAGANRDAVRLGIGDDAAVLDFPAGRQLVACTDTLVAGVHFPSATTPDAIGHKALAVNLSDLAAMGAEPGWFLLSLSLPTGDERWLDRFAEGTARLATESGIVLVGGDLTRGPLNVCVTALGLVDPGGALTRSGAAVGDLVVVSGRPGAAANALRVLRSGQEPDASDRQALDFPCPRLALGRALRGRATSCIDLSDGLFADLGHVLERSGVGAELELSNLPVPATLAGLPERERWVLQLAGGDDYELCFTLPAGEHESLPQLAAAGNAELTVVGAVTAREGLVLRDPDGRSFEPPTGGYEHFRETREETA